MVGPYIADLGCILGHESSISSNENHHKSMAHSIEANESPHSAQVNAIWVFSVTSAIPMEALALVLPTALIG